MTQDFTSKRRRPALPGPLVWGLIVAFIISASLTAYLTFVAVRDAVASWEFTRLPGATIKDEQPTSTPGASGAPQAIDLNTPLQTNGPEPQPWDGASRVNILIMGLDYGDWSADREGPSRTDTMILFTVDPLTQSAGWLHIPRDLWVSIPGFDSAKINTAYFLGEVWDYPEGGGAGLAIKTVEQFLGVPIHFYAQVDFSAFEQVIDEIGGIDLEVPAEIKVDPIGPGNTVVLQPGMQHLDGPTALAYARARNTEGGDIDRGDRQSQVIRAMRNKVLSLNMLPTLIEKSPILYQQLAAGVHTNMTLEQAIQLAWLVQQIPDDKLKSGVIGPPDQVRLGSVVDQNGTALDILIPVPNEIRTLRDEIFTPAGPISPAMEGADLTTLAQQEGARVAVMNASYTSGLAALTSDFLKAQGVNVTVTDNANEIYSVTTIIDYTGKPYTRSYLLQVMGIEETAQIYFGDDPNNAVDIAIMLGADWANSNPMP